MRAARFYGKGDLRVEDIDEPKLTPGKCIVDVEWCGICGSDLHEYLRGSSGANVPHVLTGEKLPITMGHELCGRVRNPSARSGLSDGDAVMVDPRVLCRSCEACTSDRTHGCHKQGYLGSHTGGGFAERCVVEEHMLHKLPKNCPLESAAVIEPLAVVNHAIRMTGVTDWASKSILVIGGGPIGLAMIIALKAHGAQSIIVSEPTSVRRQQVTEFVVNAIDPTKEDVVAVCNRLTETHGVDIVFDCAGVPAGLASGFQSLKLEGIYMNVAVWEKPIILPMWDLTWKHVTVKSSLRFSDEAFAQTMAFMAEGRFVGYERLITGRINLEDVVEGGFEELISHKDKHIKILVSPKEVNSGTVNV